MYTGGSQPEGRSPSGWKKLQEGNYGRQWTPERKTKRRQTLGRV